MMFVSLVHECCVKCRGHWQLVVLCPVENRVVWFCSLRRKPDVLIKSAINKYGNHRATMIDNYPMRKNLTWVGDLRPRIVSRSINIFLKYFVDLFFYEIFDYT